MPGGITPVTPTGRSGLPHLHLVTGKPPPGSVVGTTEVDGTREVLVELDDVELDDDEVLLDEPRLAAGVVPSGVTKVPVKFLSTSTAVPEVRIAWRG